MSSKKKLAVGAVLFATIAVVAAKLRGDSSVPEEPGPE